jgi:gluconate 5-dehydrogenase
MDLFSLGGRLAVVTGGAKGIGRYIAEGLAEAGADLIIADIDAETGATAAQHLRDAYGIIAQSVRTDVSDESDVIALGERISQEHGKLDILVNNAGILGPGGPPESLSLASWERMIRVDLTGPFLCCRELGPLMIAQKAGKIINIASIYGLVGSELIDVISYHAAKAGLIGFTKDLALKWVEHGICVNSIAPGYFLTPAAERGIRERGDSLLEYIPMRRVGGPDDIKGVAVFLASAASDYVTGQTIIVDGGWTIR